MELIRAVSALFAIVFGIWGLPAVWDYWSRERRISARIERQGKVLDRVADESVRRIIQDDNERAAKELASMKVVPIQRAVALNAAVALALYAALFVTILTASINYGGRVDGVVYVLFLVVVAAIGFYVGVSLEWLEAERRAVNQERNRYIDGGLSPDFIPTQPRQRVGWRAFFQVVSRLSPIRPRRWFASTAKKDAPPNEGSIPSGDADDSSSHLA